MEGRIRIFLLKSACVLALFGLLQACSLMRADEADYHSSDQAVEPGLERRAITEADIDSEDFEVGAFVGAMNVEDFGTNLVYGARVAFHFTEDFFGEMAYGRTDTDQTSFEKLSGGAKLLSDGDRRLEYYNASLGYNILPGEVFMGRGHAFNSALYLIAGVGSTEFAGDSHFTTNVGVGFRLLMNDWIALHLDFRDHIFESDVLGSDKTMHNLEGTTGLTFFF
jgi:outer membrane beta-barrel protein